MPDHEDDFDDEQTAAATVEIQVREPANPEATLVGGLVGGDGKYVVHLRRSDNGAEIPRALVTASVSPGASVFPSEVLTDMNGDATFIVRGKLGVGPFTVQFGAEDADRLAKSAATVAAPAGAVYTIANTDASLATSLPGAISTAAVENITDVAQDTSGRMYILTVSALIRVQPSGFAAVIAGSVANMTSATCRSGDYGPAATACIRNGRFVSVHPGTPGIFFVEGSETSVLRRIDPVSETITTIAGGGAQTLTAGAAVAARTVDLGVVSALAVSSGGNIYMIGTNPDGTRSLLQFSAGTGMVTLVGSSAMTCNTGTPNNAFMGCPMNGGCDLIASGDTNLVIAANFCNATMIATQTRVMSSTGLTTFLPVLGGGNDQTDSATAATLSLDNASVSIAGSPDGMKFFVLQGNPQGPSGRVWSIANNTLTRVAGGFAMTPPQGPPARPADYAPATAAFVRNPSAIFAHGTGFGWVESISAGDTIVRIAP